MDTVVAANEVVVDALGDCRDEPAVQRSVAATRRIVESVEGHGHFGCIGLRPDVLLRGSAHRNSWVGVVRLLALGCCPGTRREATSAFRAVTGSPMSWTVVRCPGTTVGRASGVRHVATTHRGAVGSSVTRADAARFLAAQVLDTSCLCAGPAIST